MLFDLMDHGLFARRFLMLEVEVADDLGDVAHDFILEVFFTKTLYPFPQLGFDERRNDMLLEIRVESKMTQFLVVKNRIVAFLPVLLTQVLHLDDMVTAF